MNGKSDLKNNLKIIIITQGLSRIVGPLVSSKHEVMGIIESAPRGFSNKFKIINFFFFLNRCLELVTRRQKATLKSFCDKRQIPYYFMVSSDDHDLENWIKKKSPDVIVVCGMSQLLKPNIYTIGRYGSINLHPSFLPFYRGPNPDFWQYFDLELNPGVTVHFIDDGEDTGDIILQKRVPTELGILSPDRLDLLIGKVGVDLILESLELIASNNVVRIKQPPKSPTKRARNLLSKDHSRIIDWQNWPVERIWHVLRGTHTWLNAYPDSERVWRNQRWEVLGFEKGSNYNQPISTIGKLDNKRFFISAKDGVIFLKRKFSFKKFVLSFFGAH